MPFIDIALVIQLFENLLYLFLMIVICGTNELVIGRVHHVPDILDLPGYPVHKFLTGYTCFLCFHLDLLSMLISSCLEEHVVPLLSFKSGNAVSQNSLIGVANVRFA